MTARTDITLPPLPQSIAALDDCFPTTTSKVLTWGRAAVEADRQGRMPSDAELDDLSDEFHGYSGNHTRDGYLIPKFDHIGYARALLSRYGSSQPAATACGGTDDDRPAANEKPICYASVNKHGDVTRTTNRADKWSKVPLYTRSVQQPAVSAEPPKLTDDEIERLVIQLGVTWKEDAWKIEDADLHPMVRALLYRYTAAPVAQEPVGEVFTMESLDGSGDVKPHALLTKELPAGTKLYAAPVAARAAKGADND